MTAVPSPATPPASALDTLDQAIVTFQAAYRAVVGGADALLAQQGLGRSHHKILFHVARYPLCSVTEVRDFIGVTRQALQRPLSDLHDLGYLETRVSPANRRIHQLILTETGLAYEAQVSELVRSQFATAFAAAGDAATAQWLETMTALAATGGPAAE